MSSVATTMSRAYVPQEGLLFVQGLRPGVWNIKFEMRMFLALLLPCHGIAEDLHVMYLGSQP